MSMLAWNGPACCRGRFATRMAATAPAISTRRTNSIEHLPVVEDGVECICLVALQGQIRFKSWIGRLVQPFVRI